MALRTVKRLNKILTTLDDKHLSQVAHKEFVKQTPIRTGNARRHTFLNGREIDAAYPYAGRLEQGYSSQAPRGMAEPTIEYLRSYIKKLLGI